ncbi:hypothetical protein D5F51_08200 [Yersinia hibernica]|uniref:Secreted protein n=1 Tax=Yersinia hibernica TaxID=2339259 RepID=A0ABX5QYT6_9GAMM|nr:hypothetical protein D5F51_08200 [Yersinia hibernica]
MLLLLVMNYGLTLFYLANSISNDIHCVHSIKQQDISLMLTPHTLHNCLPDTTISTLLLIYPHQSPSAVVTHPPLTLACCCP